MINPALAFILVSIIVSVIIILLDVNKFNLVSTVIKLFYVVLFGGIIFKLTDFNRYAAWAIAIFLIFTNLTALTIKINNKFFR